jgi:hypothetical protein
MKGGFAMESDAPRDEDVEPTAPTGPEERRVPDWHIVTLPDSLLRRSSGAPMRGRLEVRPGDEVIWQIEVPPGSRVGLGLRLPEGAPVRSFGPFAALDVSVLDLDGINRNVEIVAAAGDFPGPSLSLDFAMVILERLEVLAPRPAEPVMALTEGDPTDPTDTSLKIDKMSKPPDANPGGRRKKFPFFGEGRWQKILVDVTATPGVNLWLDPGPPSEGSNPGGEEPSEGA